jgi:hypothetical protein
LQHIFKMQIKLGILIGAVFADNLATSFVRAFDALNFITEEGSSPFFPLGLGVVITDDNGIIDYSSVMRLFTTENQEFEVLNTFANELKSFLQGLNVGDVQEIQQLKKALGYIKNIEHAQDEDPEVKELCVNVYNNLVTEFPALGLDPIEIGEEANTSKNEGVLSSGEGGVVFDKRMVDTSIRSNFFDENVLDSLVSIEVASDVANDIINKFLNAMTDLENASAVAKRFIRPKDHNMVPETTGESLNPTTRLQLIADLFNPSNLRQFVDEDGSYTITSTDDASTEIEIRESTDTNVRITRLPIRRRLVFTPLRETVRFNIPIRDEGVSRVRVSPFGVNALLENSFESITFHTRNIRVEYRTDRLSMIHSNPDSQPANRDNENDSVDSENSATGVDESETGDSVISDNGDNEIQRNRRLRRIPSQATNNPSGNLRNANPTRGNIDVASSESAGDDDEVVTGNSQELDNSSSNSNAGTDAGAETNPNPEPASTVIQNESTSRIERTLASRVRPLRRSGQLNTLVTSLTSSARALNIATIDLSRATNFALLNSAAKIANFAPRDSNGGVYNTDVNIKNLSLNMIFRKFGNNQNVKRIINEVAEDENIDTFAKCIAKVNDRIITSGLSGLFKQDEMTELTDGGVYKYYKALFIKSLEEGSENDSYAYGKILTQLSLIDNIDETLDSNSANTPSIKSIDGIDEYNDRAELLNKYSENKKFLKIIKAYKTPMDLISEEIQLLLQYTETEDIRLVFNDGDDLMDFISNNEDKLKLIAPRKLGAFYSNIIRQLQHCKSGDSMSESALKALQEMTNSIATEHLSPEARKASDKIKRFTKTNANKLNLRKGNIRNRIRS